MSRIERWFINRMMYEVEHPGFPNLILGLFGVYYLTKWRYEESKVKGVGKNDRN